MIRVLSQYGPFFPHAQIHLVEFCNLPTEKGSCLIKCWGGRGLALTKSGLIALKPISVPLKSRIAGHVVKVPELIHRNTVIVAECMTHQVAVRYVTCIKLGEHRIDRGYTFIKQSLGSPACLMMDGRMKS